MTRSTSSPRRGLWLLCSLPAVLSLSAIAQTAMTPAQAHQSLAELNARLEGAFQQIPKTYGADPAAERQSIEQANAEVDAVIKQILGVHTAAPEAFSTVQQNVGRLKKQLKVAAMASEVSLAQKAITDKHARGEPAAQGDFDLYGRRVADLGLNGGEVWAPVVTSFRAHEATLRNNDSKVVRIASTKKAEAAQAEVGAKLEGAFKEANRARREVERMLDDQPGPVPRVALQALLQAANKVAGIDPGAARYYLRQHRLLSLASALREPDKNDAAELAAQVLEGGLVTGGRSKSSTLKLRFSGEEDWCYALVLRFVGSGEDGSMTEFHWETKKQSELQPFAAPQPVPGWQRLEGVCTTGDAKITARAKVDRGDNELRYAVVGWPRKDLPAALQSALEVRVGDSCDFDAWRSFWEKPIPGSRVIVEGRPSLVAEVSPVGSDTLTVLDVAGARSTVSKSALAAPPPATAPAPPPYRFAGCPAEEVATHKRSVKLAKCYATVERRNARALKRATSALERADDAESEAAAKEKLKRAQDAEARDRDKACGTQERQAADEGRRAYERVLDAIADRPLPKPNTRRAAQIVEENKAQPLLR